MPTMAERLTEISQGAIVTDVTIFLVEDEAIIALAESQMLRRHGYRVIVASSGESAVETVQQHPEIRLILMDIDLGAGIGGTLAAQQILEQQDIPIMFLSSHTEPEVVHRTEGITSYGYIVKNSGETCSPCVDQDGFQAVRSAG